MLLKRNAFGHLAFVNPGVCFAVKGVFMSDSGMVGDPVGDFAAALLEEVPNGSAPLFALSSGMPSEPATDTVIHWFEEQHISGRTTVTEALDTTETGVDVADASFLVAGAIIMSEETGEKMFVTSISGLTLTVVRGFAGTTAQNTTSGTGLQKIGNAFKENSDRPDAMANLGDPKFNFTQIFRDAWQLSRTAQAIQFYTGSKLAKNKRDAALQHSEAIERSLWFGSRMNGVVGGNALRTMDGIDAFVTTNVTAAGSDTDWIELDDFVRGVFAKNIKGQPNERVAFCGNTALSVVNGIARIEGTIMLSPGATEFGLNITRWITPYGQISLLTHPLFNESPLWTKDLRLIHPGAFKTRWLTRTFEDTYDANGRRAGVDGDYGVFTSELSCEYGVEKTGGRLTGLTEAVATS